MKKLLRNPLIYDLGAALLFIIIAIYIFQNALTASPNWLLWGDDVHKYSYYVWEYLVSFLKNGEIPLWDPYTFSGEPFIEKQAANIFYPINILLLPFHTPMRFAITECFHIFWAMLGMYFFTKKWTSRISAWFAGLAFGLSGFFSARIFAGHIEVIAAASWMPWVISALINVLSTNNFLPIGIAAIFIGLQILAGYPVISFFTIIAAVFIGFFYSIYHRTYKNVIRFILSFGLGYGLSAIQLIPTMQYIGLLIRSYPKTYYWISYGYLTWDRLWLLINPNIFGDKYTYGPFVNYWEHSMYIGVSGLIMSIVSIVTLPLSLITLKRKPHYKGIGIIFFTMIIIGLYGLWVSLAYSAKFDLQYFLWKNISFYQYMRYPSRHLILLVFALSFLSALGLDSLSRFFNRFAKIISVTACIVLAFELIPFAKGFIVIKESPKFRHDPYLISVLKSVKDNSRYVMNFPVWEPPNSSLDFNSGTYYQIQSATGYDPLILRNYYEFINAANGYTNILREDMQIPYLLPDSLAIPYLSIRYILEPVLGAPLSQNRPNTIRLIVENKQRWYNLWENTKLIPRYFLVSQTKTLPSRQEVYDQIKLKKVDLSKTVVFDSSKTTPTQIGNCQLPNPGDIRTKEFGINKIEININSNCDSYLVSSDVFYPGWVAYLDGRNVKILEGNLAFRTVFIPKGQHELKFVYVPTIFIWSTGVTILVIILIIVYSRRDLRRNKAG